MTRDEALSVLGLERDATREEISAAYRELAQMLHPDKYGSNKKLRARAEQQMRSINEARDILLKGAKTTRKRSSSSATSPDEIAFEAHARAKAAETARLSVVAQLRTMRERRRSMATLAAGAAVCALVLSRLRGSIGALGFSIASMLVLWGIVDTVMLSGQIETLKKRSVELLHARDAARDIARQAEQL